MKSCPHCKQSNQGFVVRGFMAGPAESYYDENGKYSELNMDKTYWTHQSAIIRCVNCLKIRHDVYLSDRTTILEKEK
jgi:hypothetical protein